MPPSTLVNTRPRQSPRPAANPTTEESLPVTFTSTVRLNGHDIPVRVEATVFPSVKAHWWSGREAKGAEGVLERVYRVDNGERLDIAALGTIEGGRLELDAIAESLAL